MKHINKKLTILPIKHIAALILIGSLLLFPMSSPAQGAWCVELNSVCPGDENRCPPGTTNDPDCDGYIPGGGGGAIPPDTIEDFYSSQVIASSSASKNNLPPAGACWKTDPKSKIAPVSWYWPVYKNVHLQIYDSTGAWWFNGWTKSNSYTVFSKDGKGQYLGIPLDGRTVFAKISYGKVSTPIGKINCTPK